MAEIENQKQRKHAGVKRMIKKNLKVDLTPMVDLGFLLITFFVFTTTMAEAKVMQVNVPNDKLSNVNDPVCESCALTVILGKDNKIWYYEGEAGNTTQLKETTFNAEGLRDIIRNKKVTLVSAGRPRDQFVLIIKPTEESSFQNFVDAMDEAVISNVKRYYVAETDSLDKALMAKSVW